MKNKSFEPNLEKLEIEITSVCNLKCDSCDRSSYQAHSNEFMTVEQIKKFVDQAINANYKFKRINILGGEPTLHPKFFDVLNELKRYKDYSGCKLQIISNGHGDKVNSILNKIPDWCVVKNTSKESSSQKFSTYNIAPRDLYKEFENADYTTGCWITANCGLGLTKYGFYCCGAGASVDRVFGFNIGIKNITDVAVGLKMQMSQLCSVCGHFKDFDIIDTKVVDEDKLWTEKVEVSESWQKAYKEYKINKPVLDLF